MPRFALPSWALLPLVAVALASSARAQTPAVDRIESRDFQPGKTATLTAHGKGLTNPLYLWTPFGQIPSKAPTGKPVETLAQFEGPVPADVTPGVYETRVVTQQGISTRRYLVLDDLPTHALPDASEANPPSNKLPTACCVNGYVNTLKPKFVGLDLTKGQAISVEVFARRLDSPLDPALRLTDATGKELAFEDDTPGLAGDAQFRFTAPADGTYTIELRDVSYSGGGSHYFHLRIGDFALSQGTFPRRTTGYVPFGLITQSNGDVTPTKNSPPLELVGVASLASNAGSALASYSTAIDEPAVEQEPNNTRETAMPVAANTTALAGRFQNDGDIDWFKLATDKPTHLCVTAHTRDVGSPADVVLQLHDASGKLLQESDDAAPNDAQLSFALPAAGDYFVAVKELAGHGGPVFTYDLELQLGGRIELSTTADVVAVPANGTVTIPVAIKRMGITEPIRITVDDLPKGITASPVIAPANQKTAFVALQATAEATTDFRSRLRLQATPVAGGLSQPVMFAQPPPAANNYALPRLQTGTFIHATTAAQFSLTAEPAVVELKPAGTAKVVITATRTGDWTQPIDVASAVPAAELPVGVTIAAAQIKGSTTEIVITTTDKAVPGQYSLSLHGTLKKDKTTITQPVPTISLKVAIR